MLSSVTSEIGGARCVDGPGAGSSGGGTKIVEGREVVVPLLRTRTEGYLGSDETEETLVIVGIGGSIGIYPGGLVDQEKGASCPGLKKDACPAARADLCADYLVRGLVGWKTESIMDPREPLFLVIPVLVFLDKRKKKARGKAATVPSKVLVPTLALTEKVTKAPTKLNVQNPSS